MRSTYKIGLIALIIVMAIMAIMFYVTNILKDDTVKKHHNQVKLHVSSISNQVTQTVISLNNSIDSLSLLIGNNELLNSRMKIILAQSTFIRSINVLDEKDIIINSSNEKNIGKTIKSDEYYPKPMFNNSILRFGNVLQARDFFDLDQELSIIPISKKITINQKTYNIVFTINNEYFTNQFVNHLDKDIEILDIIRIDGKLLYTSNKKLVLGTNVPETVLFKQLSNIVFSSGIEFINKIKYISAYQLTDTFPLAVSIKYDYDKGMENWQIITTISLIFMSIFILIIASIIIKLILKYTKSKNNEIETQKILLKNQEKIKNAYIVYENTNDGILITDVNRNIIDVNKSFVENTGYTFEEVYGKNPRLLKSNLQDEKFYENMWNEINTNHYWHGEVINKNKNGDLYVELLTINTVFDDDNMIKNYVGIFTNITKQKEQELLLKEQDRFISQQSKMASMGEMLENIAHQWRQPLSIISTAATGIKMEKEFGVSKEESEIEKLTIINDAAQHLSKTIDDFRDFFKPDKKKEKFFIEDVYKHAMNILESKFKNRNIIIIENIDNLKISGYRSELVQVFMNILNNARDVLENQDFNERFITINIYHKNKNVIIEIADSGTGIDKDIINKLFEPYFTTKHKSQGTGIGLYMSEEIITKHMDGTISASNSVFSHNGKTYSGACFRISIPSI